MTSLSTRFHVPTLCRPPTTPSIRSIPAFVRLLLIITALFMGTQAAQAAPTTFNVPLTSLFTDTGVAVANGQTINISAGGDLNWFTGGCPVGGNCHTTPNGVVPASCPTGTYPYPSLNCLSLIGKIGASGTPFLVGFGISVTATAAGDLYLGVNDNNLPDNTGSWVATIDDTGKNLGCNCTASGAGTTPSADASPSGAGSGSEGSSVSAGGGSGSDAATGFSAGLAVGSGSGFAPRTGSPGSRLTTSRAPAFQTGNYSVDTGTGNLAYQATDYTTAGQNPLMFTRFYNSRAGIAGKLSFGAKLTGSPTRNGPMGANWRSNFEGYLQIVAGVLVTAERPNGQQLRFTTSGGTWTPDTDVDATLTVSGTTWTLKDSNDTVETYSASVTGGALLTSVKQRNGYTQTLTYNGSNQLTTVTDSYSRTLTIAYNTNGTIHTVTTPDSTVITYGYSLPTTTGGYNLISASFPTTPAQVLTYVYGNSGQPNLLTSVTDEDSNTYMTFGYSGKLQANSAFLASSGYNSTYTYNTGGTTTATGALSTPDTYTYTTIQGAPKVSGISRAATTTTAAATESFGYDSNGYINSFTDWNGNQKTFVNNSHGYPTTINEAVGSGVARTTTIVYDTTFVHLPATITTPGVTIGYTYDANGEVLTKTLTDTTSTSIPYSTNGQTRVWTYTWTNALLTSVQTPRTDVTAITNFGYGTDGALTSITDALGNVTNITAHTGGGRPTTIVDPNSVTTTLAYDARQRLTSRSVSGTGGPFTTSYTIDPTGEITTITYPDSSTITNAYTVARQLSTATDILGNRLAFTYDNFGNQNQAQWKTSGGTVTKSHTATFDALGRRLTDVGGQSQTTTYTYDKNGNALTVKDGLTNITTRVFDALNRISTSTDPKSGVVTFTYDAHDRILTLKDPNLNTTSYVYDGFGDVIQQASPDTGTTVYHYDKNGNLTSKTDALSVVTNQTFDKRDRVLTTAYPADSTLNVAYTYDQTGTGFTFGIGRLTTVTDQAGTLTRAYDSRGNLLTEKRVNGTTTLTTTYTYDAASRIASITYPSGALVTYVRDTAGRVTSITSKPTSGSSVTTVASSVTYEPFGPIVSFTYGNGVADGRSYDNDYRLTGIVDLGTVYKQFLAYGYDAGNNLHTITDSLTPANSQTLGYDVLNRITSAVSGTSGYGTLGYTYDANGNWTQLTTSSPAATITYGYTSGTDRLASITNGSTITVSTNANGNITSIPPVNNPGTNATWNYSKANRLASVSGSPTAASYTYDAFGKRMTKVTTSTTYYTYGQDGALLEELNGTTNTSYIYLNGLPVANLTPSTGAFTYIHTDNTGAPAVGTNSAQTIVWLTYRQPHGLASTYSTITQDLRFPGQVFDAETSFHNNGFRDYMSFLGRYLEADPIGLRGGTNPYAYANNNPSAYTDKLGLCGDTGKDGGACPATAQKKPKPQGDLASPLAQARDRADDFAAPIATIVSEYFHLGPVAGLTVDETIKDIGALFYLTHSGSSNMDSDLDSWLGRQALSMVGITPPLQMAPPPLNPFDWESDYNGLGMCTVGSPM